MEFILIIGVVWLFTNEEVWFALALLAITAFIFSMHSTHTEEKKYRYKELKKQWDQIRKGSEGFVAVCRNELWGFVDTNHEIIVPPIWEEVHDYKGGYARVKSTEGLTTILDTHGDMMMEPLDIFHMSDFKYGICEMTVRSYTDPKSGETHQYFAALLYQNKRLKMLFDVAEIGSECNGYFIVKLKSGGVKLIGKDGLFVQNPLGLFHWWASATIIEDKIILFDADRKRKDVFEFDTTNQRFSRH